MTDEQAPRLGFGKLAAQANEVEHRYDEHQGCEHPWDVHILAADNTGDPLDGGTWFCPEGGCTCVGTWDVRDRAGNILTSAIPLDKLPDEVGVVILGDRDD